MGSFIRPKARFKIGNRYTGTKTAFIAQGYVIFKEWDAEDRKFYYWEEWELTGFNNYDSWVEYDHYSQDVTMYQPVRAPEEYDVLKLKKGDPVTVTIDSKPVTGTVGDVGTGIVAKLKGKMSYQLFDDDTIHYAEVKTGSTGVISIEDYRQTGDTDYDYYQGRVLTKKEQKELFGRVVAPFRGVGTIVLMALLGGLFMLPLLIPQYETTCTPRSTISAGATAQSSISDTSEPQQDCKRVRVYGGGGGGVGK